MRGEIDDRPRTFVLFDRHRLFVSALAAGLREAGHDLAAVASTPERAVTACAVHEPDWCLLGIGARDAERDLAAARKIVATRPGTQVLALVAAVDPGLLAGADAAGVAAVARKDRGVPGVLRALAAAGAAKAAAEPEIRPHDKLVWLTEREREVLRRMLDGQTTKQIARVLRVAPSTVRTHVQHVLAKLGVRSRMEAAALVATTGLPG